MARADADHAERTFMIAWLISRLVALASVLFVASLPVSKTGAGAALRRWAAFCFIAAIVPSFFFGVARDVAPHATGASAVLDVLGGVFLLLLISAGAYLMLMFRRRSSAPRRRLEMKQPFTPRRGQDDFLSMLREQLGRDDE
jgi:cation transport ATPase